MTEPPVALPALVKRVQEMHPGADPLLQLSDAASLSAQLAELSDQLLGHFVDAARAAGASWSDIGQHLGVSKQAVQKRYVSRVSDETDFPASGRLSRFTPRARTVLQAARRAATQAGAQQVGSLHLLMGLLSEPQGLAARALVAQGQDLGDLTDRLSAELPGGRRRPAKHSRFSRQAKNVVKHSLYEALRLGHNYIGTEHFLLALCQLDDDPAAELLHSLGVTHDAVQAFVTAELARPAAG